MGNQAMKKIYMDKTDNRDPLLALSLHNSEIKMMNVQTSTINKLNTSRNERKEKVLYSCS